MSSSVRLKWDGDDARREALKAAEKGLGLAMEHLLGESRKEAPLEEGTLERSGTAVVRGREGAVYFDTVYARRQHEELTWRHDPGRKAKYLEDPFNRERETLLEIVAAQVREALGP
ncbi:hypothetical protein ACOQFV_27315 [Nocardiopsis changdeensis]|uniref:HK97 gp10 family phage protein n=1 Tax=Nocardiopsis changdeensis TaxID=2831969 RepID=A0ABX8BQI3_9ACTN|nr:MULTISPECIES: hypothetical protein [Nocardiopsis]QUX22978.1 hypothetical protein KGD84_00775 [Nocardiopsis changdeensis]QYX38921.1 hypothetical protein K1J57_10225 [Nocardiopsis sp. MT53]